MYYVVVGASEFAIELAKLIFEKKEDKLILVVKRKDESLEISDKHGITVVNGDPARAETLDELELERCDVFVSATDSEKDNVLAAIYAKNAGAKKIFVSVDNNESEPILRKLDFTPINRDQFAARAVEIMITRPAVSELVNIGSGQSDIIEITAKNTKLVGKEIGKAIGTSFITLATYSKGNYVFDKEKTITKEDTLILLVKAGKEKKVEKELSLEKQDDSIIDIIMKNIKK